MGSLGPGDLHPATVRDASGQRIYSIADDLLLKKSMKYHIALRLNTAMHVRPRVVTFGYALGSTQSEWRARSTRCIGYKRGVGLESRTLKTY